MDKSISKKHLIINATNNLKDNEVICLLTAIGSITGRPTETCLETSIHLDLTDARMPYMGKMIDFKAITIFLDQIIAISIEKRIPYQST